MYIVCTCMNCIKESRFLSVGFVRKINSTNVPGSRDFFMEPRLLRVPVAFQGIKNRECRIFHGVPNFCTRLLDFSDNGESRLPDPTQWVL